MALQDNTKQKQKLLCEHMWRAQASLVLLTGTPLGSGCIYRGQYLVLGDHKLAA